MRILRARQADHAFDGEKPGYNSQEYEVAANGDSASSTSRDAADMRKLGVQQETKGEEAVLNQGKVFS